MERQEIVSVFKRLYLLFIALIAVIYGCIIILFMAYADRRRQEEIETVQAVVSQSTSALRDQLDIVSDLERTLVSDDRTETIFENNFPNDYERARLRLELIRSMQNFQSMNNIIGDIALMFPGQNMELSVMDDFSRKECFPRKRIEGDTARTLIYADQTAQMELWYPLTISAEPDYVPDFGVRVILSQEYLQGLLAMFRIDGQEGAFYVLHDGELFQPLFLEDESENGLAESWRENWEADGRRESFQGRAECGGKRYLFLSVEIPEYGITLVTWQREKFLDASTAVLLFVMGGVILIFGSMFLLVLRQTDQTVNKPLQKLVQAFGSLQEGDLSVRLSHRNQDEFRYLYSEFNRTAERIGQLIENVKEQGRLLQNAELIQLQSQINPHFLYNSFYIIRIMAKNESYEQITSFVTSLAKYYRFLNKEVEQNIPLAREAEHMGNYIDIQQMRFGDKITVQKGELPKEAADFCVPKLILQPVVENAYNYGVKNILQDGCIAVNYEIRDGFLYILIEDNGNGCSEEVLEQMRAYIRDYQGRAAGHALSNIDRRLKLAFGEDCGILLDKSRWGGLKVILKLNLSVKL